MQNTNLWKCKLNTHPFLHSIPINTQHSLFQLLLTHHSPHPPPPPSYHPHSPPKASMGCCVSTNNKPTQPRKTTPYISTSKRGGVSKSPPPSHPLPEEEIVKEILSETPTLLVKPLSPPVPKFRHKNASPFIKSAPLLRDKEHRNDTVCKKPSAADDAASEVSEICSTLSESVSVSTSVTENREHNGDRKEELREARQRSPAKLRNRPFSGEMHRERTVGRSPGRRSEPSPGRVRPVTGSGYGRRRESGESSGRRSTSPAMRPEAGVGRAQSGRKTGKSPGRVGPGDKIRKLDGGKESGESKWAPTNDESLENPLVSLECFIFL